ncbi:peptidoglycan recognition protein family protein [Schinkia azotoformans]|uniref:peptidoglycan recognition protein family protein n=1 Tax=Schinkia azotoformans TaxID=1454 RepID=UPI002DBF1292|nr:peptidoglycan recognition family protein [Schinkia azotoformans]MEC1719206.1 peptidoglycan recognition family protein [Schinkia azotoformans]MED4413412.1 peptidoglycan recognition family protein [Schinkia azotoformans]
MARNFKPYMITQFQSFIHTLDLKRKINHIQIHHTWEPRKSDYKGESTIASMWRYHTETRGWQDIGQHFTVAPDGLLWDGRSLEKDPAGITGYNRGGIMFEMIGNFDQGEETLEGKQLDAIIAAVRVLLSKFNLSTNDIVFHREHSAKTCPGTGITRDWFLNEVKNRKIMELNPNSYDNADQWKRIAIDWLYEEGLISAEDWKDNINKGLPLWAEALVLKRIYDKAKS